MNMKLKALVVAASLAFAGNAMAEIKNGITVGNTDQTGELFMIAYDTTAAVSYTFDTGLSFASFLPGNASAQDFDLSSDSNFTSFLGGTTAANIKWAVGAYQSTGGTGSATRGLLTTAGLSANVATETSGLLNNLAANNVTFLTAVNLTGTHKTLPSPNFATNGSSYNNIGGNAYAGAGANAPKSNWNGATSFSTVGALDDQLSFYKFSGNGASSNPANVATYAGTWSLTSGSHLVYNVAAVPEPGTWAMLIAGLMMVGGIARRRMS